MCAYRVSDCLVDRHPYSRRNDDPRNCGPTGVTNGHSRLGLENLVAAVAASFDPVDTHTALQHLLTHAANAALKMRLLVMGIVPHVAAKITLRMGDAVDITASKLLIALAVLPQGSACVVLQGGVEASLILLRESKSSEVCVAASGVIRQVCCAWDGRAVLLGTENGISDEARGQREVVAQDVAQALVDILERPGVDAVLQLSVLQSLSQLTYAPRGIELVLMAGALRSLHALLQVYANVHDWVTERGIARDIVHQATLVTWNVAMDDIGKRDAVELDLPALYGKVLKASLAVPGELMTLKSSLAGAFAAIFIYEATKCKALDIVDEGVDVLSLLMTLLRQGNDVYAPMRDARKHGHSLPPSSCTMEETSALVTNTVQAIRLVCELPSARERAKQLLKLPQDKELRKQLFKATDIEVEMQVGKQ